MTFPPMKMIFPPLKMTFPPLRDGEKGRKNGKKACKNGVIEEKVLDFSRHFPLVWNVFCLKKGVYGYGELVFDFPEDNNG
jgi:hypothetical protein